MLEPSQSIPVPAQANSLSAGIMRPDGTEILRFSSGNGPYLAALGREICINSLLTQSRYVAYQERILQALERGLTELRTGDRQSLVAQATKAILRDPMQPLLSLYSYNKHLDLHHYISLT